MAKPKLALVPAAQGSKFYSVLPSSGVGDFTFSRSGSATRINSQGLIETVGNGVSRLNYPLIDGVVSGCPHHILEPSSTNLITYSEDFSQWSALSGVVVTDNFAISPNGTQNASKLVFDGTTNGRIERYVTASGTNTQSVYLKTESGTQNVSIGVGSADLTEFTITDQWVRYTHTGVGNYPRILCNDAATIYAWGCQYESGSYATSYIPTSGSTYQRQSDVVNGSGNSEVFNDSEGVLFADIAALADDGTSRRISLTDVSGSTFLNLVSIELDESSGILKAFVSDNIDIGILQGNIIQTQYNKIALKYNASSISLYVNGFELDSNNTPNLPSGLKILDFNNGQSNQTSELYGKTKEVGYYDAALTDSELEYLTSYRSLNELVTELNLNTL